MTQVAINGQAVTIVEYAGQRVVTLGMVDTLHQRPEGTARRNFNTNKQHFVEGEDYVSVCADEIRTRKILEISPKAQSDITLLTESGYAMLAKSFTDDLAWEVQRQLVRSYFGIKPLAAKEETPEELALRAVTVLQAALERQREENRLEIERQKALIDAAAPKVAALEELAGMDGVFGLREAAKECSWPEGKFIQRLHEMRWIFKQEPNRPWQAHADKLRDGLLAHKTYEQTKPNGEVSLRYQVVVTAKGLTRLAVKLGPVPEGKRAVPFAKKPEPAS